MNGVRLKLEDAAEVEKYVESALADFSVEVMLGGSTLDDGIVLFTPGNVCVRTENGVVFEAPTKLSKVSETSAPGVIQIRSGARNIQFSTDRPTVLMCCFESFRKLKK